MVTIKILNDPNELKNNCNRTNFQEARVLEEAIKKAISMAKKNDIIVLAGKGHETYQEINHVKHPYDERVIIKNIIDEMTENK